MLDHLLQLPKNSSVHALGSLTKQFYGHRFFLVGKQFGFKVVELDLCGSKSKHVATIEWRSCQKLQVINDPNLYTIVAECDMNQTDFGFLL